MGVTNPCVPPVLLKVEPDIAVAVIVVPVIVVGMIVSLVSYR